MESIAFLLGFSDIDPLWCVEWCARFGLLPLCEQEVVQGGGARHGGVGL